MADRTDAPQRGSQPAWLPPWAWVWRLLASIAVTVVGTLLFLAFFRQIRNLLIWILIALFASFALEPATAWLAKRGWRRGLATGLLILATAIIGIFMVALMVPLTVKQVQALITNFPSIMTSVSHFTKHYFGVDVSITTLQVQLKDANSAVSKFAQNVAGNIFGFASSIVGTIFKLLTIGLFTFYLTADGPRFRRAICSYLPAKRQATVLWTWEVAIDKTGAYLYSRLLLAILSGIFTFIVLTALHIPFALPLSVWMGVVSQFVPTIGTYIAMALPLLVAVVEDPVKALILLVLFTVYQQIENYLLSPRITARTMNLHPALAFGCAIAGASISGIVGAFLALPFAAIVQALGSTYIHRHEVEETDLTRVASPEDAKQIREARRRERGQKDRKMLWWAKKPKDGDAPAEDPG